jgi:uncharacterized lipoprotein YmbA
MRWVLAMGMAALVLSGCASSEKYAQYEPDDRPPGRFAPSSRELTAQRAFWTTLYIGLRLFGGGCGDD